MALATLNLLVPVEQSEPMVLVFLDKSRFLACPVMERVVFVHWKSDQIL